MWQAQHLKVPMRIREEGREERSAPVLVTVSIEADAQSSTPRNLMCFQVRATSLQYVCTSQFARPLLLGQGCLPRGAPLHMPAMILSTVL
jgi:hypothetical protein